MNFYKHLAKSWKKSLTTGLVLFSTLVLVACSSGGNPEPSDSGSSEPAPTETQTDLGTINVISREPGSGTRGAFVELIELIDGKGNDLTTENSEVANSTAVMMTSVEQNVHSIGYISLGSLGSTVKALAIDGIEATVENVANGSYAIQRPFNIVLKGEASAEAKAFIDFILSPEGQTVISEGGYVPLPEPGPAYDPNAKASGQIAVCGSTSVGPIMEKLQEAYAKLNAELKVEVQQNDSSTGIKNALDGTCQIGMSSRDLKDSEIADGAAATKIATDGIAVIVNLDNPTAGLSLAQVKDIFGGTTTEWSQVA